MLYTRGFAIKEKIQLYGMALIFLVLLYNSPAGLVLYWTMNNIFTLIKNCLLKARNLKVILYVFLCLCVIFIDGYILFFRGGTLSKRMLLSIIIFCIFTMPIFLQRLAPLKNKLASYITFQNTALWYNRTFVVSSTILFLLAGLVIPGALVASSVQEFSYIENYTSPVLFIFFTLLQSAGLFLFWPSCLYFLFSKKFKMALAVLMTLLCGIAMVDTFIFPGNYGFLTTMLEIADTSALKNRMFFPNAGIILAVSLILCFLLIFQKKIFLYAVQSIVMLSLLAFGTFNVVKIQGKFKDSSVRVNTADIIYPQPEYTFSKNGKNVLVILLDRGMSGYVPCIFDEKPELNESFSGFKYYPNCISFAGMTLFGVPGIYGGYEYTPLEMQKRDKETNVEKNNEALLMLPKLFSDNDFLVTVTDPPDANYQWVPDISIFDNYPGITANTILYDKKYVKYWKNQYNYDSGISTGALLKNNLIRFSIFKMLPPLFREIFYSRGTYFVINKFKNGKGNPLDPDTLGCYIGLDVLPEITVTDSGNRNTYTSLYNYITHQPAFFQSPDYQPFKPVTDKGSGPFADENHYHVNMASFLLLGKWFDFLKKNNVYDNTRIIIVSDHGFPSFISKIPNNPELPDGSLLQSWRALLLVKDFNQSGSLKTDNSFMTNADVPLLAVSGLIDNPVNPFTNVPLKSKKDNGVTITTGYTWNLETRYDFKYPIGKNGWLHVHDDIFDPDNWEQENH
jgi:hypothetical protein